MHALGASVPAEFHADPFREIGIPGRGQGDAATEGGCRAFVADTHRSVRHAEARHPQPRDTAKIEEVDAPDQFDLLLERHLFEDRIDALFHFSRGRRRVRRCLCHGGNR